MHFSNEVEKIREGILKLSPGNNLSHTYRESTGKVAIAETNQKLNVE